MSDHHHHAHSHSRPAPDLVEDGVPAISDAPPAIDIDAVEGEPPPLDEPQGVEEWGTTAAEEAVGEPFELRVKREQPERLDPYDEHELAEEIGIGETINPEEEALRVVDEPPGMSYSPDPGYLADND